MKECYSTSNSPYKIPTKFYDILSVPSNPEDIFTLQYPIGQGAYGKVYKAIHNRTKEIYAIKIVDFTKNYNNKNNLISYNYNSIQQETLLMKTVNNSNYILKYYGSYYSRKSNTLWLILEYCSSGSLIDLMCSTMKTLNELEVSTIMENILKALQIIHNKKLIHRDIKAANILLSSDGYAKLADFGVGTKLKNEKYIHTQKGSPYWMSPQMAKNIDYDFKTDIWSLGITCIELVDGEPPFSSMKPENVIEKISKFPPKINEILNINEHSKEFIDFVSKCLEVCPEKRPTASKLLKHPFIKNYAQGKKYIKQLVKKHFNDVELFRKQFLKAICDNDNDNDIDFSNINGNKISEKNEESIESTNGMHSTVMCNDNKYSHLVDENFSLISFKDKAKKEEKSIINKKINDYIKAIFKKKFRHCQNKNIKLIKDKYINNKFNISRNFKYNSISKEYKNSKIIGANINISSLVTHHTTQGNSKKCSKVEHSFKKTRNNKNFKVKDKKDRNTVFNDSRKVFENLIKIDSKVNYINNNDTNNKPMKMTFHKNNISYINDRKVEKYFKNNENISDNDDDMKTNKVKMIKAGYYKNIVNYCTKSNK